MRGGAFGLVKVLLLLVLPLLLRFESDSVTSTTRAVAAAAAYNINNDDDDPVAPLRRHRKLENRPSSEVIQDAYIIILNDNVMVTPETIAKEYGITIEHSYQHAIKGFSSRYVEADILDLMLEDSRIWAVGEDGNLEMEHEVGEEEAEEANVVVVQMQAAAPPQLDQIDQSMDGMYSYSYTGAGVHIYVVDAGILASHEDFGGRVATPCFDDIGPCNTDTDSHGTHIASTAGGSTYGVAKGVTIHDTRVYDANGIVSWSGLMSGLDYVAGEQKRSNSTVVVNVSLGGGGYNVVDAAVQKTLDTGAVIVVAAGNQAIDACTRTPARVPGVVTVGATGALPGVRRPSSNYGPCLDIWAPGKEIIAASNEGENQYSTKSGTSMSAPLVVGAIALYIEAGKTVLDMLNDAQLIATLAGTDQSPTRFLSIMKLNEEKPEESTTETFTPTTTPAFEPSFVETVAPISASFQQPSNGATFAPIPAPTFLPSNRAIADPTLVGTSTPIGVPGEGALTVGTLFPSLGPNLAPIPAPIVPPSHRATNDPIPPRAFAAPTLQPSRGPSLAPIPFPTARPMAFTSLQPSPRPTLVPLPITTMQPSPRPTLFPIPASTLRPTPVPTLPPSPRPSEPAPISAPTLPPSPVPTRLPVPSPPTLAPSPFSPAPTREQEGDEDSSSTIVVTPPTLVPTIALAPNPDRARYPSMIPRVPLPPPSPPRFQYPTVLPQSREQPDKDMTLVPTQRPYGNFTFIIEPPDNEPSKFVSSMATKRTFMDGNNCWIMCIMIPIFWLCT